MKRNLFQPVDPVVEVGSQDVEGSHAQPGFGTFIDEHVKNTTMPTWDQWPSGRRRADSVIERALVPCGEQITRLTSLATQALP